MSTTVRRRPVLGFFAGLVFGLGLALVLFVFGILPTTAVWLVVVTVVGAVLGVVTAYVAPARSVAR